ncbi:cytidine deaminase [Microlunatus soli]|uniref:Acyl dehydratase n=1 Tax=Microlunatus soli TaxID=630515 RepID=A0A1H1XUT5_9ACTN|nr:cytidine deaminase [Microlunatus soli]SDT13010.1 Acyl dehydratase [Microlunatus soli]
MTGFDTAVEERYFEDYRPGTQVRLGAERVTEADVLRFAREFDPQSIHVDVERAAAGPFGGLIASGWHTAALMMRVFATSFLNEAASLASPGVDELRWLRPVRPGDILSARFTVLDARPSRSKPDRGVVRTRIEMINADDEPVLTMIAMNIIRRRTPGPAEEQASRFSDVTEACRTLITERFADGQEAGAAAMLLADGTILTGTAPEVLNPSVESCHELEPFAAAYRLGQPILASICLHRRGDGSFVVLSPCGVCRERLAIHGPDVRVAVTIPDDPTVVSWEPLSAVLPHYWMTAFADDLPDGWTGTAGATS